MITELCVNGLIVGATEVDGRFILDEQCKSGEPVYYVGDPSTSIGNVNPDGYTVFEW